MVLTGVGLSLVSLFSFLAYRRRRDRFWAMLAGACIGGLLLIVLTGRFDTRLNIGLDDVGLALLAVVVAAEAFGLPSPIARRIGIGLRSREFEYDRTLSDLLLPLNELIEHEPPRDRAEARSAWQAQLVRDGGRRLLRLERLRAPDDEWAALTASYALIYATLLRLHAGQSRPAERNDVAEMVRATTSERERLRAKYRSEAAALGSGRVARFIRGRW